MRLTRKSHFLAVVGTGLALILGGGKLFADVVLLNGGGSVHGNVVASADPKNVVVRTATGAMLVFDRNDVKSVQQSASSPKKSGRPARAANKQLTAQEKLWLSRIGRLVSRLEDGDSGQVRLAKSQLLKIHDPAALPALARYLGNSSNVALRGLFIQIVRGIADPRTVYALVALSVFDPVPAVREEARSGLGAERADAARGLYIEMLKRRRPGLSSLASEGLAAVGDPHGESIPYLIDNLQYRGTMEVMTRPGRLQIGSGGIECQDEVYTMAFTKSGASVTVPFGVLQGDSLESGLHYVAGKSDTVEIEEPNTAVLDSLVKISGQKAPGFGYRREAWRRWWKSEKPSRQGGAHGDTGAARSEPSPPTSR